MLILEQHPLIPPAASLSLTPDSGVRLELVLCEIHHDGTKSFSEDGRVFSLSVSRRKREIPTGEPFIQFRVVLFLVSDQEPLASVQF